jgi:hypothetical protein
MNLQSFRQLLEHTFGISRRNQALGLTVAAFVSSMRMRVKELCGISLDRRGTGGGFPTRGPKRHE